MLLTLRHALRMLRNNPGFTLVAIGSLTIGIGFTSASFSIADVLLLRPMPVLEPSRVVAVTPAHQGAFGADSTLSYPDYRDLRDHNRSFDGLIASDLTSFGFSRDAATLPKVTYGAFVSGNYFRVLGVQPVLGRAFVDSEDGPGGRDAVVVLGHDFWASQFNSDPSAVGSTVRLNGVECTVIGVAGREFSGVNQMVNESLFLPISMLPRLEPVNALERRDLRWFTIKGRLKPGVSVAQANADASAIAARLGELYPETNKNRGVQVETELQNRVEQVPPQAAMAVLQGVFAICVLLVACANVAGLLLSRARARSREMAVRLAIGGSRGALVRQLLAENLVLAMAGGAAGILLAYDITDFFNRIPVPSDVPINLHAAIDQRILLFTLVVSIASTFVFGLAPALKTTRVDLIPALKATTGAGGGRQHFWGRNAMVVGQVALSLLLLVVCAVSGSALHQQLAMGPGFRTDHLYLTGFDTQPVHYSEEQTRKFYRELLERTRRAPGVRSAALSSGVPLGFDFASTSFVPEGYTPARGQQAFNAMNFLVSDGYFATQGLRLIRGRGFLETDRADTPRVAVVNAHFAEHYWPGQDAVGKRFHLRDATGRLVTIVGIAETAKYVWIAEPPLDYFYLPYTQYGVSAMTVLAESDRADAAPLGAVVREVVRKIDPAIPVVGGRTMHDFYTQRAVKTSAIIGQVILALGIMGLVLAMVGLYALIAYSVSRRAREIGIRMAIGADRRGVLQMVLRQGLNLGAAGVALGLALSMLACRALASSMWLLAGSVDYAILPAVALPVLAVTLMAAYIPARRASLIDPMNALREE